MDCDSDEPQASDTACEKVLANFEKKTDGDMPPCIAATCDDCPCPCYDAGDVARIGIDFEAQVLSNAICTDSLPNDIELTGTRDGTGDPSDINDPQFWGLHILTTGENSCHFVDNPNGISRDIGPLTIEESQACFNIFLNSQMSVLNNCQPSGGCFVGILTDPDPPTCIAPCVVNFAPFTVFPGSITSITWNFGDGTIVSGVENPSHEYTEIGIMPVSVSFTDSTGIFKTAVVRVNILGTDPVASFEATQRDGTFTMDFDASLSASPNGAIVSYRWDFGDGTAVVTTASETITHTYSIDDFYAVSLTITDSTGATDHINKPILVAVL